MYECVNRLNVCQVQLTIKKLQQMLPTAIHQTLFRDGWKFLASILIHIFNAYRISQDILNRRMQSINFCISTHFIQCRIT